MRDASCCGRMVVSPVAEDGSLAEPDRQNVLMDMCFNLGTAGLLKFKAMLAAVEARDFDRAADEMLNSAWARQVRGRAQMLPAMMKTGIA